MKLYYSAGSCSLSPHIILRASQLDFELVKVDLQAKKTQDNQDYLQINPKGSVPALALDNQELLTEGAVLVQYIADLVPEKNLIAPAKTLARYHMQEWLNYIATELHKNFGPLFRSTLPEMKRLATETLQTRFQYVENCLENKHYLMGKDFCVADAYLFTVLRWALKFELLLGKNTQAFIHKMQQHPAVKAALAAEGLSA